MEGFQLFNIAKPAIIIELDNRYTKCRTWFDRFFLHTDCLPMFIKFYHAMGIRIRYWVSIMPDVRQYRADLSNVLF